jgi:hypothetical protein
MDEEENEDELGKADKDEAGSINISATLNPPITV